MVPRAFTLIELLAVVAIMSLVSGVLTIHLAAETDAARRRAAATAWTDLDARARLYARTGGPVVMTLNAGRTVVRLHRAGSAERLAEVDLPAPGRLTKPAVLFDRFGHSVDYAAEVTSGARTIRWHVLGLTGQIQEGEP